jgi:hypothetical protein
LWRYFPSIKVHCWGGFGSQLYGLAIAHELNHLRNRRIILVLHTSGVTERKSEISHFGWKIRIQELNDFKIAELSSARRFLSVKKNIKTLLIKSRIVMDDDVIKSIDSIMPWTISLRGHYTNIVFSKATLQKLSQQVLTNYHSTKPTNRYDILIHYRLGDLLTLDTKKPLEGESLYFLLQIPGEICIVSDSPEIAGRIIAETTNRRTRQLNSTGGFDVIRHALEAHCFIGSSSKVSDWAILFRLMLFPELPNYAPISREKILEILCSSENSENLFFFE